MRNDGSRRSSELNDSAPSHAAVRRHITTVDWIRGVKWVIVALLALWLLTLFISWLGLALV
jgi:hypothetical protein